mgnify:CR=1 FL=1
MSVRVADDRFLDGEQLHLHAALRWLVPISTLALDEITILTHPGIQPFLADFDAVLLEQFSQLTDQDIASIQDLARAFVKQYQSAGSAAAEE